jgi:hypothetical protein
MAKVNYNKEEWAIAKNCGYCGKKFYPLNDENFCDFQCEDAYEDYGHFLEDLMLNERRY